MNTQVVATILMLERRLPRSFWPRVGVCGLSYGLKERWYLRVEDRDDPLMEKKRRFVKMFSKEDEKENEGEGQSDAAKGSSMSQPKNKEGGNKKDLAGWEMIRRFALGLEMEQDESEENQEIINF